MSRPGKLVLSVPIIIAFVLIAGCGIVETDAPEWGSLTINAYDSSRGEAIRNAEIQLNGIPRQERTPATIGGLLEGQYHVAVYPADLSCPEADTSISITPPEQVEITLVTGRSTAPGWLVANTTIGECDLVIDEHRGFGPDAVIELMPGTHAVSLVHPDCSLPEPGYVMVDIRNSDTTTVTLETIPGEAGIEIGLLAPDLTLSGDIGEPYTIGQFRGSVLLLNFAGFKCDPCLNELPEIQQVYEDYYDDGFRVLVINVGWWNEDAQDFADLRDNLGLTMPLLFPDAGEKNATNVYGIYGAPTNVLIDRCGIIRNRFGGTTASDLLEEIEPYL